MARACYNVWTRICDPGRPSTRWHLLENYQGLEHDEATRCELAGNRISHLYHVNVQYRMMPEGQRPIEDQVGSDSFTVV